MKTNSLVWKEENTFLKVNFPNNFFLLQNFLLTIACLGIVTVPCVAVLKVVELISTNGYIQKEFEGERERERKGGEGGDDGDDVDGGLKREGKWELRWPPREETVASVSDSSESHFFRAPSDRHGFFFDSFCRIGDF